MPMDMSQAKYDDNSPDYKDFEAGEHYLQLSQSEKDMVNLVCENFENVVVLYNGTNPIEMGFVNDYKQIKAAGVLALAMSVLRHWEKFFRVKSIPLVVLRILSPTI